jgi:hypothetical protein
MGTEMHGAPHENYPQLFRQLRIKSPNIKFYENPFNGSRLVPCLLSEMQTDGTNSVDEPEDCERACILLHFLLNCLNFYHSHISTHIC